MVEAYAQSKSGAYSEALYFVELSLKERPENVDYLLLKAEILEATGNFPVALKILDELKGSASEQVAAAYVRVKKAMESGVSLLMCMST